jgi:hypothetical protein
MKIEFDGDFDGGNYYMTCNYLTSTHRGASDTETKLILKQDDIDALYEGAKQLVRILEKHVTEGY